MSSYYILVFDNGSVARITHGRHNSVSDALKEQYGSVTECLFAKANRKADTLPIATGDIDAEWWEIYRNAEGKYAKRKTNQPKPKVRANGLLRHPNGCRV